MRQPSASAASVYQVISLEGVEAGTTIKLTADVRGKVAGEKDAYMRLAFYSDTTGSTALKDEKGNGIGRSSGYL